MKTERLIEGSSFEVSGIFHYAFLKESESFYSFQRFQRVSNASFRHNDTSSYYSYPLDRCSSEIKFYPRSNLPIRWKKVDEAKKKLAKKHYGKKEVYEKIAQRLTDLLF